MMISSAISEQEKQNIRQGLISHFGEPISQIALQRAVLIAKIARIDCPKEWPQLFPTLLQAVESPDLFIQHRAFLTLYHVVKAIASKRLIGNLIIKQQVVLLWHLFGLTLRYDVILDFFMFQI